MWRCPWWASMSSFPLFFLLNFGWNRLFLCQTFSTTGLQRLECACPYLYPIYRLPPPQLSPHHPSHFNRPTSGLKLPLENRQRQTQSDVSVRAVGSSQSLEMSRTACLTESWYILIAVSSWRHWRATQYKHLWQTQRRMTSVPRIILT